MRKSASLRSGALFLVFTDHLGHVVEGHALVTADGEVLVVQKITNLFKSVRS